MSTNTQQPPIAAPLLTMGAQLTAGTSDVYRQIFATLVQTDCSKQVEKKNGMSYLSWAFAIDMLLRVCPDATFKVCEFGGELVRNPVTGELVLDEFGDVKVHNGEPFQKTGVGYFVKAKVRVKEVTREMRLPVIDTRNKPIAEPNAFDINTSGMRCLTKAIAMHGLGLFLYQGEDLPATNPPAAAVVGTLKAVATTPAAAAPTSADLLEAHTRKLALANTSTLFGYHQNAGKYFKDAELVTFRASIAKRAAELKVTLPELPLAAAA